MEPVVPARPGVAAKTVEISWHAKVSDDDTKKGLVLPPMPISEVSFHPCLWTADGTMLPTADSVNSSNAKGLSLPAHRLRLATIGDEGRLKIWEMNPAAADTFLFSMGHKEMANVMRLIADEGFDLDSFPSCVRWSPNGHLVAVGTRNGKLTLFRRDRSGKKPSAGLVEKWDMYRQFLGGTDELMDIAFSPDSSFIMTNSRTGTVFIYSLESSRSAAAWVMHEMHATCLSLAWDPWGRFIATFGANPALKMSTVTLKPTDHTRVDVSHEKRAATGLHVERDTLATLRMNFSPDGMLLAVPFGKSKGSDAPRCVYIYTRDAVDKPTIKLGMLEGKSSPPQGVAWAPGFFEPLPLTSSTSAVAGAAHGNNGDEEQRFLDHRLPWGPYRDYRMALAVWNEDTIVVYTTDSSGRFAYFNNLHADNITSVSWSPCARYLLVSSLDTYVSLVHFYVPIGAFHPTLAFVKPPSACLLLAAEMEKAREKGRALEEKIANVGTNRRDGEDDAEDVPVTTVVRAKKKVRPEAAAAAAATPVVADADALAAQLEL